MNTSTAVNKLRGLQAFAGLMLWNHHFRNTYRVADLLPRRPATENFAARNSYLEHRWVFTSHSFLWYIRADSRFAHSQWETALLCNDVSHWLGASLESALYIICYLCMPYRYLVVAPKSSFWKQFKKPSNYTWNCRINGDDDNRLVPEIPNWTNAVISNDRSLFDIMPSVIPVTGY